MASLVKTFCSSFKQLVVLGNEQIEYGYKQRIDSHLSSGTIPVSVPSGGDGPIDQDQSERTEEHDNNNNNRQSTNITPAHLEQVRNALMGIQAPGRSIHLALGLKTFTHKHCHRNTRFLNNFV